MSVLGSGFVLLRSCHFMDARVRRETHGSETKDSMTKGAGGSLNFLFAFASLVLTVPQGNAEAGLSGC